MNSRASAELGGSPRRLTGFHVLMTLFVFFGVTIAVNVAFIYYAVTTFSGIETENAYNRGVAYNQQVEVERREAELGWKGTLKLEGNVPVLILVDRSGVPLTGMHIKAKIGRPSVDRFDRVLAFREPTAGRYVGETAPLEAGTWMVAAEVHDVARSDTLPGLRVKERLWVSR